METFHAPMSRHCHYRRMESRDVSAGVGTLGESKTYLSPF